MAIFAARTVGAAGKRKHVRLYVLVRVQYKKTQRRCPRGVATYLGVVPQGKELFVVDSPLRPNAPVTTVDIVGAVGTVTYLPDPRISWTHTLVSCTVVRRVVFLRKGVLLERTYIHSRG